jgi:cytochrome P450
VPLRFYEQTAYAVLRFEDLSELLLDEDKLPAGPFYDRALTPVTGPAMEAMTGEEHHANRNLIAASFSPLAIREKMTGMLQPLADSLIDAFGAERSLDLVARFTNPLPFRVISNLLDVRPEDEKEIRRNLHLMFRYLWEPEDSLAARDRFDRIFVPFIEARRVKPGTDLISVLVNSKIDGKPLTNEDVLSFCRHIYPAGAETTYLMMGSMMWHVLSDKDLRETLIRHPEKRPAAVEEALRMYGPVAMNMRYTEKDIEVAGTAIPANSFIYIAHASANYDEAVFEDPFSFRLDRFPTQLSPRHLSFGRGIHLCLGFHLARAELVVGLSTLLDRLPGLRLANPADPGPLGAVIRGVRELPVEFDDVLPSKVQ